MMNIDISYIVGVDEVREEIADRLYRMFVKTEDLFENMKDLSMEKEELDSSDINEIAERLWKKAKQVNSCAHALREFEQLEKEMDMKKEMIEEQGPQSLSVSTEEGQDGSPSVPTEEGQDGIDEG